VCELAYICATGQHLLSYLELFPFFFFWFFFFFTSANIASCFHNAPMLRNVTHINSDVLRQQDQLLGQILSHSQRLSPTDIADQPCMGRNKRQSIKQGRRGIRHVESSVHSVHCVSGQCFLPMRSTPCCCQSCRCIKENKVKYQPRGGCSLCGH
jgi:hypothetical protein